MNHKMRRFRQQLTETADIAILQRNTAGVLNLLGEDGYPYGVPLNYVYEDGKIFFHCATQGYKLDAIRHHNKASFTVIDQAQVIAEEYTTDFCSVIVFGQIAIVKDDLEKRHAMEALAARFIPGDEKGRLAEIDKCYQDFLILALDVEEMTGKKAMELVKTDNPETC